MSKEGYQYQNIKVKHQTQSVQTAVSITIPYTLKNLIKILLSLKINPSFVMEKVNNGKFDH